MIWKLLSKSERLGIKKEIEKPHEPIYNKVHSSGIVGTAFLTFMLFIIGGVLIIADSFFGLLLVVGAVVFGYITISWADNITRNRKLRGDYFTQKEKYNKEIKEDNIRVKKELEEKSILVHEIDLLRERKNESTSILTELYSKDIVYPKYRNLVMMCSIYEYLCSGRCITLDGHEGAYNILEMEIRLDRIIVQLDRVLSSLAQIQTNQYMLYDAIQEGNRIQGKILDNTNQIISSMNSNGKELNAVMESIDKNSALASYAAERSQKELEYMNTMNYLESKWRGTGFNQPPSWRS